MFLTKCCLRRGSPALILLTSRRFLSSPRHDPSSLPRFVVEKAKHYIETWMTHAIPAYFRSTVLKENVSRSVRLRTADALLDLLLRKRLMIQALEVLNMMRGQRMRLSAPIRAKILTVQFVRGSVWGGPYFYNLESLLRQPAFMRQEAERHFLDILHLLAFPGTSPHHLERVVRIYLSIRGSDYQLHSSAIGILIACHLAKGNEVDAERWLDYHSRRPVPEDAGVDPAFCSPYTAYAQTRLVASPEKDPRDVYGPILDRMARDRAWPDSVFINVLITAELKHSHYRHALTLYDTLCSHTSHGVYPDETTYSKLFDAAAEVACAPRTYTLSPDFTLSNNEQSQRKHTVFPKSRRQLFHEMVEIQLLIKHGHLPLSTPVITKVSLGAALKMFVTHEDYAAAIITLKAFDSLRIPLEQRAMDMVITSIVRRCQKGLASESPAKKAWAEIFLDLREIPRRRVKGINEWEMRRRVISVARGALAIAEARSRSEGQEATTTNQDEAKSNNIKSPKPASSAVSEEVEIDEESPQEKPASTIRAEKKLKMRERRFQLIDLLLSRALDTTVVLQGHINPHPHAFNALSKVFREMLPNEDDLLSDSASFTKGRADSVPGSKSTT